MTLTGPQVLAGLDEALRDIRREEDEIMRKLGRSAERVTKLRDAEAELLPDYAQNRIEPGRAAALTQAIETALAAGRDTLRQRASEMAALAERLATLGGEQTALVGRRAAALNDIDRQQAALRGLSGRIAQVIARDATHAQQQASTVALRGIAEAAQTKARQAERAWPEKLRPFERDPLFMYLLGRDYGTPDYGGGGLTAMLDGWVARLSNFPAARAHYLAITTLPAGLVAHAGAMAAEADAAEAALDALERAAIDAAGGGTVRMALEDAQQRIAAIDGQLLELQAARNAATAAQGQLAGTVDAGFDQAIGAMAQALGAADLAQLMQNAGSSDDPDLVQLADVRQRVAEEGLDTANLQARLATLAVRRRELEDIEAEFKALRFDDPRALFDDAALTGARLDEFLTGTIDADGYWRRFRLGHRWSAGTDEWGGGIGLPRTVRPATDIAQGPHPAASRSGATVAGA